MVSMDPLRATIRQHPYPNVAYADHSGAGKFQPGTDDAVIMSQDENGGSALQYEDLVERVRSLGGTATSAQVAKLSGRERVTPHPAVPAGAKYPAVDYVYRLEGDTLSVEYRLQPRVQVLAAGDLAVLDNDANGIAEPEHDSPLQWILQGNPGPRIHEYVRFSKLQEALGELGGRADEAALLAQLSKSVVPAGLDFKLTTIEATPNPFGFLERGVQRTWSQTSDGAIFVDYALEPPKN
jgi:hypothetical protein